MIEKKPTPLLQKIFELRRTKKISLEQLGKAMGGVKKSNATAIENGSVPLKAEYIPAIAKLLGVEPWELFVGYSNTQIGPLSEEEAILVRSFRQLKKEEREKKIKK